MPTEVPIALQQQRQREADGQRAKRGHQDSSEFNEPAEQSSGVTKMRRSGLIGSEQAPAGLEKWHASIDSTATLIEAIVQRVEAAEAQVREDTRANRVQAKLDEIRAGIITEVDQVAAAILKDVDRRLARPLEVLKQPVKSPTLDSATLTVHHWMASGDGLEVAACPPPWDRGQR